MTASSLVLAAALLSGGASGSAEPSLALAVDHIYTKASSAEKTFNFFKELLKFPVVWEFQDSHPGFFSSGGVSVGNMHFEFAQLGAILEAETNLPAPGKATFGGLCLDADPRIGPDEYLRRGLQHRPVEVTRPDGSPYYNNYNFNALSSRDTIIFTTFYADDIDPIGRKTELAAELARRNGGPLGVERGLEIAIGAADLEKSLETWKKVLGEPTAPAEWRLDAKGPVIRIVQDRRDAQVLSAKLKVRSLSKAKQFLQSQNALGRDREGNVLIKAPDADGISIILTE